MVLLLNSQCSGFKKTDVINALLSNADYQRIETNYGTHPRQKMSVYLPKALSKPVVFFIYGGTWREGERNDYLFVAHALIELGYPVIIPDYRLFPEVRFPGFINDIADAVAFSDEQAIDLLGRPLKEFILMGHSAGAYNAALLAADQSYFTVRNIQAQLLALIGIAGPYDLPLDDADVLPVFSSATATQTNPLLFPHQHMPTTLLLHGLDDKRVGQYHSVHLQEALTKAGGSVQTLFYEGVDHTQIIASLAEPLRFLNDSYRDIGQFLDQLPQK